MKIGFSKHAREKFAVLKRHKFSVSRKQVLETVLHPDLVDHSRWPLLIAQRTIDENHVLRVVFKKMGSDIKVITFYPGRSKQYD